MLELDGAAFEQELKGELPLVVDFWAPWCMPCKIFAPVMEEMADELDGRATFAKINVDDNNELAVKYGIASIPTVGIFKGGELVDRFVGVISKEKAMETIERNL